MSAVLVALQFNDASTKKEIIEEIVSQLKDTIKVRAFFNGDHVEGSLLVMVSSNEENGNDDVIKSNVLEAASDYFSMSTEIFKEIGGE